MSHLRPECGTSSKPALPYDTAIYLIRDAVARRRSLAHGKLHDDGLSCALGAFWEDNPRTTLNQSLIDEVAAVNDSLGPNAKPHERWRKVNGWLRFKVKSLAMRTVAA